ncbi:MAG: hypothetical protein U5O16_02210 [Rhodococcus sp. (in: high G+C Gram-positive bacteria)]|uniref:hypothetical protein n=1 Tax=Rhodococcus sp. TaxID=1831 RepID=UPI002AD61C2D|nr:hypothetical protein [Rhodococcus sp. (in: high G+C Gram-positive bacteria)]
MINDAVALRRGLSAIPVAERTPIQVSARGARPGQVVIASVSPEIREVSASLPMLVFERFHTGLGILVGGPT